MLYLPYQDYELIFFFDHVISFTLKSSKEILFIAIHLLFVYEYDWIMQIFVTQLTLPEKCWKQICAVCKVLVLLMKRR